MEKKDKLDEKIGHTTRFLDYITSKFALGIVTFLLNLSLFLGNIIIFYLFKNYFDILDSILIFVIGNLLSFLFLGRIHKYLSYLWLLMIFIILELHFVEIIIKVVLLISLLVSPMVIFYFQSNSQKNGNKKEFKLYFPFPKKLKPKTILKFLLVLPRILFFNVSYFLFPLLVVWLGYFGILNFLGMVNLTQTFEKFTYLISIMGITFGFFSTTQKDTKKKFRIKSPIIWLK